MRPLLWCLAIGCAGVLVLLLLSLRTPPHATSASTTYPKRGDPALTGGTPTLRRPFTAPTDDPRTRNNEANDQPFGYFGTGNVVVRNESNGREYTLGADVEDGQLLRIYFARGGWVDFPDCDVSANDEPLCLDEEEREWTIVEVDDPQLSAETEDEDSEVEEYE